MTITLNGKRIFGLTALLTLAMAACSGADSSEFYQDPGVGGAAGSGGHGGKANTTGSGTGSTISGSTGSAGASASGTTGTTGTAGAAGTGSGGSAGSGGSTGGAGNAGGAIDAGGQDAPIESSVRDAGGGSDVSMLDAVVDATVSDSSPADAALDAVTDAGCPILALGGASEDVYVDKSVAQTGNGTKSCPFKTILEATSLASPAVSVTRRTIHVMGSGGGPDYVETQPILLRARVTLTSNYDASNPGGAATVRVIARGDCVAFTGGAVATFCAVAMENDAKLEKVTVRVPGGAVTGHAVLTTNVLPVLPVVAPAIVDVNAENAPESGFRVFGSVTLGPRVNATGNRNGLTANRAAAAALATIKVNDAPSLAGPSNSFSSNTNAGGGNGISVLGNYVVDLDGATVANNGVNGMVIGTPYTATTTDKHRLANFHADSNGTTGLRLLSGEVHVVSGTNPNTFNNNKNGYGIQTTTGDSVGDARLILEPKGTPGAYVIAHQANGNRLGGIHLNRATPPATAPHQIASLEARQNGFANTGAGIFVEIVGAAGPNQSSLELRGSVLLGNTGAGLRFQKGSANTLDIGTLNNGGYNVVGDAQAGNRNTKSGICYENVIAGALVQSAEYDRWSQGCPLPVGNATFQGNVATCGANAAYTEITYTGAVAPISAVANCF